MKCYDFDKAKKLIEENKDQISEASLGMHEDWSWTAITIYEGGSFIKDLPSTSESKSRYDEYKDKRKMGMGLLSDESMQYSDIMIAGIF